MKLKKSDSSNRYIVTSKMRFNASRLSLLLLLLLMLSACIPDRLRQANVDEVAEGMSKKQVESILGPPTDTDNKDNPAKATTYIYRQRSGTVIVIFRDDKVAEKQSTLTR
jgi:outer membrane protein assembly factor BamE (lipoprotein component of BamABCDE complex)